MTAATVPVRRIRKDEADLLRRARLAALLDAPAAFAAAHGEESRRQADFWAQRAHRSAVGTREAVFFAERDGGVVGMVGAYTPAGLVHHRHMYGMWVAPHARRRGVGRELAGSVLDFARQAGAEAVTLWVVEENLAATRLYGSLGFVPTGRRQPLPSAPSLLEQELIVFLNPRFL